MPIVFDLDDTLYPEITFVHSGYHVVAEFLSQNLGMSQKEVEQELRAEFLIKREQVFDRFLQKHHAYKRSLVKKALSLYRGHIPSLQLYPEALLCLQSLSAHPLYVVTDGNKLVQKRKCEALGLFRFIKKCFCTYAHGIKRGKPSPYCFEKICRLEKVLPEQVVYVADNPYKDFVGIRPLGFFTVRVLTGPYRTCQVEANYEADIQIGNLGDLEGALKIHQII